MTAGPLLEAVQPALLLVFLVGVELGHALLKGLAGSLSANAHLALFLDSLETGAGATTFLAQAHELVFEVLALLAPVLHLGLGAVCRSLEVDECLFKRRCELLLRKQMLLNRADACFLLLDELGNSWARADFVRGVP